MRLLKSLTRSVSVECARRLLISLDLEVEQMETVEERLPLLDAALAIFSAVWNENEGQGESEWVDFFAAQIDKWRLMRKAASEYRLILVPTQDDGWKMDALKKFALSKIASHATVLKLASVLGIRSVEALLAGASWALQANSFSDVVTLFR